MTTRLILIEGLPGSGKTSKVKIVHRLLTFPKPLINASHDHMDLSRQNKKMLFKGNSV